VQPSTHSPALSSRQLSYKVSLLVTATAWAQAASRPASQSCLLCLHTVVDPILPGRSTVSAWFTLTLVQLSVQLCDQPE
jgi:hypothetical protein